MDPVSASMTFCVLLIGSIFIIVCCVNYKQYKKGAVYRRPPGNLRPIGFAQGTMARSTSLPTTTFPTAHIYNPPVQNYRPPSPYLPPTAPYGYSPMPEMGGNSNAPPYPPMPFPGQSQCEPLPPSYADAITQPSSKEEYGKPSSYNPNI